MSENRKKIQKASVLYWLMLTYMIAAFIWWFISLERQNAALTSFKIEQLSIQFPKVDFPDEYEEKYNSIITSQRRATFMHISEGLVYLGLIAFSAIYVFRAVKRHLHLQQQQQNFMMAVTHELKTPIAITRLNLETMQKYQLDEQKQKKLISVSLQETSRLNFLTNNILIASQLDGGGYTFNKEELDLSDLLTDCMNDFQNRFPERTFHAEIMPDMEVKGDPLLLQLLANNLLENAVKYSPKGSTITATLSPLEEDILFTVSDEGEGIPDEEKLLIFKKFYRVGSETTRKTKGTGLGLFLCNKIADDHNADISVTNNHPKGSTFVVRFYL